MPSAYEFNLNGSAQGLPIRGESRFPTRSPKEWNLVLDDHGVAPESVYPNRYLPALAIDDSTGDGVVIPQGVIVSLHNVYSSTVFTNIGGDSEIGVSASGYLAAGLNAYGSVISYGATDEKNGYGDYQTAVLTIANGGTAVDDVFTSLDVQLERVNSAGSLIVAGNELRRSANIPYGVTPARVFADYRGQYLNSDGTQLELDAPVIDSYIQVPYIVDDGSSTYKCPAVTVSDSNKSNVTSAATHAGYNAVLPYSGFLYLGSRTGVADNAINTAFVNGEYLVSDVNGRFIPQHATQASALTQTKTAQTIGRLIALDNKWPKDLSELADTYEGSGMTGTDTRGIDKFLYDFVVLVLQAAGQAYTRNDVYAAIQAGRFGMATIEILPA